MFSIKIEADFSAAHNLRGYRGKCEELHGHNWKVEVTVRKSELDKMGMVMDFRYLKGQVHKALDKLDHKYLNNMPYFKKANPTSENIAKYIYQALKPRVSALHCVTVWESQDSSATYYGY